MVEIPDELCSLFSARLERRNGSYVFEIPRTDREHQTVTPEETYRVAVLPHSDHTNPDHNRRLRDDANEDKQYDRTPPVEEGEVRTVTIDTLGDQGDGIARVEHGYVLIVPNTEPAQEVTIEVEDVKKNVGFATVLDAEAKSDQEQSDVVAPEESERTDAS